MDIINDSRQYGMKPMALVVRLANDAMEMRPPNIESITDDIVEAYCLVVGLDDHKCSGDYGTVLVRVEFMTEFAPNPTVPLLRHLCKIVFPALVAEARRKDKAIAIYSGGDYFYQRFEGNEPYFHDINGPNPGFHKLLKQIGG